MAECIVCKGFYKSDRECPKPDQEHQKSDQERQESDERCQRCGSDNSLWTRWRARRAEEKTSWRGLLAFTEPYLHIPFFVAIFALAFGLLGLGSAWNGARPMVQILTVTVTVIVCTFMVLVAYLARHDLREKQMLNQVRWSWRAALTDVKLWAVILPALLLLLALLLTYALVSSDGMWEMAQWVLIEPGQSAQEQGADGELFARVTAILPFLSAMVYASLMISAAYIASLLVALRYVREMNQCLPQPIFLNGDLLARIVREQAERQLARPLGVATRQAQSDERGEVDARQAVVIGNATGRSFVPATSSSPAAPSGGLSLGDMLSAPFPAGRRTAQIQASKVEYWGNWNWEEIERTPSGGIVMKARGEDRVRLPANDGGGAEGRWVSVMYTVTADPWGRIIRITRGAEKPST